MAQWVMDLALYCNSSGSSHGVGSIPGLEISHATGMAKIK